MTRGSGGVPRLDHLAARLHEEATRQDRKDRRSPFERDRARIIHSVAFRRLQGKTQVFAAGWADFMRTRVTHSIEVSQIGRSLAENNGVDGGLVEAACLAHDLGHPPFGHTGEDALNECMAGMGGFEGNAQTFRVLTRLEEKTNEYPGLNLTRGVLLATLKYPARQSAGAGKYLYDQDADGHDAWLFDRSDVGLARAGDKVLGWRRTLACQMMDWADDIAYSVHDLEDGLVSRFLVPQQFTDVWFVDSIHEALSRAPVSWRSGAPSRDTVRAILNDARDRLTHRSGPSRQTIREFTRHFINRFVTTAEVSGKGTTPFDFTLERPEEVWIECLVFKQITFEFIIRDQRSTTFAEKGRHVIRRLFKALHENTREIAKRRRFELFPRHVVPALKENQENDPTLMRMVCDYIASMTDGQAMALYRRMFETGGTSPFDVI
jgi:dGTPase